MNNMNPNQEPDIRKEVNEHITTIREARIREAGKRETAYLTITTGALVLSVSFITISGFTDLLCPTLLAASWMVLLVAIITKLISYDFVDRGFDENEEDVRQWIAEGMPLNKIPKDVNIWTKRVRFTNNISSVSTVLGLILLVLFGISNIFNMSEEEKKIIGTDSQESEQKHAEPTLSGPSLADRLSTSTPSEEKPVNEADKGSNEKQTN
jgi:hypothetical protein